MGDAGEKNEPGIAAADLALDDPDLLGRDVARMRREDGFDYTYWNAALTLDFHEVPAFSLDVRYWDTDIRGCATATIFQCDERVVGSVTAIF